MWRTIDRVLRFAYLLAAPFVLATLGGVMPIGGIAVGAGLATVVALVGTERWQARVARLGAVGRALGGMGRLGAYYEAHPPKPLVYYIAYPLLAPYWLVQRDARREFLLYRKLGAVQLAIVVGGGAWDYLHAWRPIPFGLFLADEIAVLLFQLVATFALVMPIVTTIVAFHRGGFRKLLAAVLVVGALSGALGLVAAHRANTVSISAQLRARARASTDPWRAQQLVARALAAAAPLTYPHGRGSDAEALAAARAVLETAWKPDEARAFRLAREGPVAVLYLRGSRRHAPLWAAIDVGTGAPVTALPADLARLVE